MEEEKQKKNHYKKNWRKIIKGKEVKKGWEREYNCKIAEKRKKQRKKKVEEDAKEAEEEEEEEEKEEEANEKEEEG